MENGFNYESVPSGYAHCFNQQCTKNKKCMRHLVAKHCSPFRSTVCIINPICIPKETDTCTYFHPIQKIRIAWGVKHLFDNLPHKDVAEVKSQIINHFGKTTYYRLYRKERGMLPEDQKFIRTIFRRKGFMEEPNFDSYSDEYQWV